MLLRSAFPLVPCAMALCLAAAAPLPSLAQDASAWDGDRNSSVRLIAGAQDGRPEDRHAGVEIKLAPGWKTYWRYPGDSGVPPRFDFQGSENTASVDVLWPAPHRFTDEGGTSIGYKADVIFPLRVTAKDPKRPVRLRLKLDYAVCEKLCVPAAAAADLLLQPGSAAHARALAAVPVPRPATMGEPGPLTIVAVRREAASPRPRVVVDVAAAADAKVDLFAEGPTPDWALPIPQEIAGAPDGQRRFAFELDGVPDGASAERARIRLTAVAGRHAIEVVTELD